MNPALPFSLLAVTRASVPGGLMDQPYMFDIYSFSLSVYAVSSIFYDAMYIISPLRAFVVTSASRSRMEKCSGFSRPS
eukprot:5718104-Ditylum_brightwellii.AAC.1